MITDALLGLFATLFTWLGELLPAWDLSLPEIVHELIASILAYDDVFPVSEALLCLSLEATYTVGFTLFKWGVKIADWIADIIP